MMDDGEGVEFDFVLLQNLDATHDFVEAAFALLVIAMDIVDRFGTIDGDAHEEVIFLEELAPLVIKQGRVGLQGIDHRHAGAGVLLFKFHHLLEELDAHERRFATLKREGDLRGIEGLAFDVLADVSFELFFIHPEVGLTFEEFLFFEIETIGTVEVTDRPDGLGHHMERYAGAHHRQ